LLVPNNMHVIDDKRTRIFARNLTIFDVFIHFKSKNR
jgi:hypothetical protein